jgi:hypothetical protein
MSIVEIVVKTVAAWTANARLDDGWFVQPCDPSTVL